MNYADFDNSVRLAIEAVNSQALEDEIGHFLSVAADDENPIDYYDALTSAEELALNINDRKVLNPARRVLIALGVYKHVTEADLAGIQVFSSSGTRRTKWDFQIDRKKYIFDNHPAEVREQWKQQLGGDA